MDVRVIVMIAATAAISDYSARRNAKAIRRNNPLPAAICSRQRSPVCSPASLRAEHVRNLEAADPGRNRTGANGIIGTDLAPHAPRPTGTQCIFGNIATLAIIRISMATSLRLGAGLRAGPLHRAINACLVVHPSLPGRSVRDLIAFAKRAPSASTTHRWRRQRAAYSDGNA